MFPKGSEPRPAIRSAVQCRGGADRDAIRRSQGYYWTERSGAGRRVMGTIYTVTSWPKSSIEPVHADRPNSLLGSLLLGCLLLGRLLLCGFLCHNNAPRTGVRQCERSIERFKRHAAQGSTNREQFGVSDVASGVLEGARSSTARLRSRSTRRVVVAVRSCAAMTRWSFFEFARSRGFEVQRSLRCRRGFGSLE